MNVPCCDKCGVLMYEGDLQDCLLCGISARAVYVTYKDGKLEANFRLPEKTLVSGVLLEADRLGSDGTIFTEEALKELCTLDDIKVFIDENLPSGICELYGREGKVFSISGVLIEEADDETGSKEVCRDDGGDVG